MTNLQKFYNLGEIFVNDAFSCSHRAHASIDKITKFLPSYCGIQIDTEVNALKKLHLNIKRDQSLVLLEVQKFQQR